MSMEIKTVGIIGAGAIGSYFLWGMKELTESRICMIASGERKKRLEEQGLIINEETIHYPVKTPSEAHGVDLLLIATKYGALRDILDDVKTIVDEHTIGNRHGAYAVLLYENLGGAERKCSVFQSGGYQRTGFRGERNC